MVLTRWLTLSIRRSCQRVEKAADLLASAESRRVFLDPGIRRDRRPYHLGQNDYSFDALQTNCSGINIKL